MDLCNSNFRLIQIFFMDFEIQFMWTTLYMHVGKGHQSIKYVIYSNWVICHAVCVGYVLLSYTCNCQLSWNGWDSPRTWPYILVVSWIIDCLINLTSNKTEIQLDCTSGEGVCGTTVKHNVIGAYTGCGQSNTGVVQNFCVCFVHIVYYYLFCPELSCYKRGNYVQCV